MQTFYEVDVISAGLTSVGVVPVEDHHPPDQPRDQMQQTDGPDSGEAGPGPQPQYYLLGPCYHLIKQNNKKRTYRKEVGCLVETCNSNMKLENIEVSSVK